MQNTLPTRHRSGAFSLIELMVVIAIITALIAMLLPVLERARLAAADVSCKSNLRQIGTYIFMYQAQYRYLMPSNDQLQDPTVDNIEACGPTNRANPALPAPYAERTKWTRLGALYNGRFVDLGGARIFYCPIWDRWQPMPPYGGVPYPYTYSQQWSAKNIADATTNGVFLGYSIRNYLSPSSLQGLNIYTTSGATPPGWTFSGKTQRVSMRRTLVSCQVEYGMPVSGSPYDFHNFWAQNGRDGYNFLFTDGSVEHMPLSYFTSLFGNKTHPKTNHVGYEHFADADYLFGINDGPGSL